MARQELLPSWDFNTSTRRMMKFYFCYIFLVVKINVSYNDIKG